MDMYVNLCLSWVSPLIFMPFVRFLARFAPCPPQSGRPTDRSTRFCGACLSGLGRRRLSWLVTPSSISRQSTFRLSGSESRRSTSTREHSSLYFQVTTFLTYRTKISRKDKNVLTFLFSSRWRASRAGSLRHPATQIPQQHPSGVLQGLPDQGVHRRNGGSQR